MYYCPIYKHRLTHTQSERECSIKKASIHVSYCTVGCNRNGTEGKAYSLTISNL